MERELMSWMLTWSLVVKSEAGDLCWQKVTVAQLSTTMFDDGRCEVSKSTAAMMTTLAW